MRARLAIAVLCAGVALLLGCTTEALPEPEPQVVERTAAERGAEAFASSETSRHPFNRFSCSTCHAVDEAPADRTLPGSLLAGVTRRPTFWAGEEIDLLRSVNQCLQTFMLDDEAWTGSEPVAVDIWAFLESISPEGASAEPAPFTVAFEVPVLPAGDATVGEAVFQRACAGCHGTPHEGEGRLVDFAPVLPEDALASHPIGKYTPPSSARRWPRRSATGRSSGTAGSCRRSRPRR